MNAINENSSIMSESILETKPNHLLKFNSMNDDYSQVSDIRYHY